MKLRHQDLQVAMGCNEIFVNFARMTGRVTKPKYARYLGEATQQVTKRCRPAVCSLAMIGVDVLPNQGDLADARPREVCHFCHNRRNRSRYLGAARIRHHTECAELVAALLN